MKFKKNLLLEEQYNHICFDSVKKKMNVIIKLLRTDYSSNRSYLVLNRNKQNSESASAS